jgi:AcrR family transcriptional regulator
VSISRKRLDAGESRSAALGAARRLLVERGPQAVTLKAVAAEVGRTHANLLHHFGSAAGLQTELARSLADQVTDRIAEAVERARLHETDPREIVDRTFDTFGRGGAGALAAWMILSGNRDALGPILEALRSLVAKLSAGHEERRVSETTLWLVLMALGDALLGEPITETLGLERDTARDVAAERLRKQIDEAHPIGSKGEES